MSSCKDFNHLKVMIVGLIGFQIGVVLANNYCEIRSSTEQTRNKSHSFSGGKEITLKQSVINSSRFIVGLSLGAVMALSPMQVLAKVNTPNTNRVEITMSADERQSLLQPTKTTVPKAEMVIVKEGQVVGKQNIELSTRGQTSLKKFPRKNLAVEALKPETTSGEKKAKKSDLSVGDISSSELILSASPEDQLGTKNMIVYRLYKLASVPALETDYAELMLNEASEGLYIISENPKKHMMKTLDADIVLRRRYNDVLEVEKYKESANLDKAANEAKAAKYRNELSVLVASIKRLSGQALVTALSKKINLEQYMRWLAVNYIVQNGDYTDEVFFFGKLVNGQMYFNVFPWDLDDTFNAKMHQESIPFTMNHGKRDESDRQMLYSYESRIDQAISEDSELLKMYFSVLEKVTNDFSAVNVNNVFKAVKEKLNPYLSEADVLKAGELDSGKIAHDPVAMAEILKQREQLINSRVLAVKKALAEIQANGSDQSQGISTVHKGMGLFLQSVANHLAK